MRLPVLGFAVFAAFQAFFGPMPLLTPYSLSLGASLSLSSWIVGAYSLANLAGSIAGGFWIQRFGAAPMLQRGLLLTAASIMLYPLAASPADLLGVRLVHGFTSAWIAPAAFVLAAAAGGRQVGRGMGRVGAPIGLAALAAPPIAALLAHFGGLRWAFAFFALVVLAAALIVKKDLSAGSAESVPAARRAGPSPAAGSPTWRTVLANRGLWLAWMGGFALPFNLGLLAWYLPVAAEQIGLSGTSAGGAALGLMALTAGIVMAGPGGRWADTAQRTIPLLTGTMILAAGMLVWQLPAAAAFFAAPVIFGVGFGLLFPAANALIADVVEPRRRGIAFGGFYAWFSVGAAVSPPFASWWGSVSGWNPFITAAVITLAVLVIMRSLRS